MKREILHTDGTTKVIAKGLIDDDNVFNGEYKFQGMTYGVHIPLVGCEVGDHDLVPLLGYENIHEGEICRQCSKTFK